MEGSGNSAGGAWTAGGAAATCVLLHAPGASVPTDLLAALSKRIKRVSTHADSYLALAEVCAAARASRAAPKATVVLVLVEPRRLGAAAEIVEAARRHAPNVSLWWYDGKGHPKLQAVGRGDLESWAAAEPTAPVTRERKPQTSGTGAIHRVKPVGGAAFRPVARGPDRPNEPPRVVVRPGGGLGPRQLRLVGLDGETPLPPPTVPEEPDEAAKLVQGPDPAPPVAGAGQNGGSLLSEEELRMLLSDDEPDEQAGESTERSQG